MKYLLGIDNGGTFSKAAIFDENGKQISVASVPTVTLTPKPGYTEKDLNELWQVNADAIRGAIEKSGIDPKDIAGVSFSGAGKGLYMVGHDGKPSYNGIMSTDTRAWAQVEGWYKDGTNKKVYEKTFQEILAVQPVSLLAWFKENQPEVLENTKYIFAVKDYIRYMLTGEAYSEYTDCSGGNLVNMVTGEHDKELMALYGLEDCYEKLPPLRHSADLCGHVTKEASGKTLLPEGTPVAAGMFDVNACGIASGLSDEEQMCMIAGTWSINEFIGKEPVTNGTVALNSMFCIPGYYLIEESSPTSAGNMEWFVRNLMNYEKEEAKGKGGSVYDITNEWATFVGFRRAPGQQHHIPSLPERLQRGCPCKRNLCGPHCLSQQKAYAAGSLRGDRVFPCDPCKEAPAQPRDAQKHPPFRRRRQFRRVGTDLCRRTPDSH